MEEQINPVKTHESSQRIIMHIDLDAFFASCEEVRDPDLKNKAVVIGSDPMHGKGRGVVSTANYIAREYGIKSAMPISWAYKKNKNAVFLPVDYRYYSEVSVRIMEIIKKYSETFEQAGIDEAYLDVSNSGDYDTSKVIALKIKDEIYNKEKLSVSIGIGPNKLIAKIASDYKKPAGLTIVKESDVQSFLGPMDVSKLHGIGPKTTKRLRDIGLNKVNDLLNISLADLRETFGENHAEHIIHTAKGIDNSSLTLDYERKSIGRMYTFLRDTRDTLKIYSVLGKLIDELYLELTEESLSFKTLTVRVRYEDFETHTKQKSFKKTMLNIEDIKKEAINLIDEFLTSKRKVRLIGISFSNLSGPKNEQKKLF